MVLVYETGLMPACISGTKVLVHMLNRRGRVAASRCIIFMACCPPHRKDITGSAELQFFVSYFVQADLDVLQHRF